MSAETRCVCCDLPEYSCGIAWARRNGVDVAEIDKAVAAEMGAGPGRERHAPRRTVVEKCLDGQAA